ncbi:MAG: hypothetical protein ACLFR0_01365 [Alphaproteobacteria bacterium]
MPTASEVKSKFEEFLEQLTQAQDSLNAQKDDYVQAIKHWDEAGNISFAALFSDLEDKSIVKLDEVLKTSNADWTASDLIEAMTAQSNFNAAKAKNITQKYGSAEDIYARLEDLHESILPLIKQYRRISLYLYADTENKLSKYNKTAQMLDTIDGMIQNDLTYRHSSVDGIKKYNEAAREKGEEEITSDNFESYQKSLLWHGWSALSQSPEVKILAAASNDIRKRPAHFVKQDLQAYEKLQDSYADFKKVIPEIKALQEVYNDLMDHESQILDQDAMQARLRDKVKQSLSHNKEFRQGFAQNFGEEGHNIIAAHAKQTALEQIDGNIGAQVEAVGKAIDDIHDGLKKLHRVSSSRTVRVDLEKIEKSIEEGVYDIDLYVDQMKDRRTRVQSFTPQRNTNYDDGMYFNYMMLYILLADNASFDSANHDMSRDLSAQFGDALPDLAALDIENFNMNTISIPGVDIGASIDVGSSLSGISSSIPSPSDYGGGYSGGYDGGSSFGGGFDGGAGGGF